MIKRKMFVVSALALFISLGGFLTTGTASETCDRECLKGFITQYLNALIAQKPESLSTASTVKFTENCKQINLGQGLWTKTLTLSQYRLDFIDVRQGGAVAFAVLTSGSTNYLLAVRLKIVKKKITEIETIQVTSSVKNLQTTHEPMTKMPDASQLNSRDTMIKIASKYPEGLRAGGTFAKSGVPFSSDAYRFENDALMAGKFGDLKCSMSGCENISTQGLPTLPSIVYHVAVVDEQAGVVVLRLNFGNNSMGNQALDVFEAFKIYGGQIHAVEAFYEQVPNNTPFGWDYTAIGSPSFTGNAKNTGNMISTKRGASISLQSFSGTIAFDLYDVSGKLVYTKAMAYSQKNNSIFIPTSDLPGGHYIGRVHYYAGSKIMKSSVFNVNIMR
jgi:hypothetical protein